MSDEIRGAISGTELRGTAYGAAELEGNMQGVYAKDGDSAYQVAVNRGFKGSETEWINSLKGESAYMCAINNGFRGTKVEWLASLKGETGVGIASMTQTQFSYIDGGTNSYEITTTDGKTLTISINNGTKGHTGDTPFINENGNWQIGNTDTGVKAIGADGKDAVTDQTYTQGSTNAQSGIAVEQAIEEALKKINRKTTVTLYADSWETIGEKRHIQVVDVPTVTSRSELRIDLTPEQIITFKQKDITFLVGNYNGTVKVECIGQMPTNDYEVKIKIEEVNII